MIQENVSKVTGINHVKEKQPAQGANFPKFPAEKIVTEI